MNRFLGVVSLILLTSASAICLASADERVLKGSQAMGGWQSDNPGILRHLTPGDLPAIGEDVPAVSSVVKRSDGVMPRVPADFSVEMMASGFNVPRVIRVAPNGDLFLAESGANRVRVLRLANGKLSKNEIFASDLRKPYGIAFYPLGPNPQWVYVANTDSVVRFPYHNGDLTATGRAQRVIGPIPWVHH